MYGKVWSACTHGIEGRKIEVEIDLSKGLPQMNMVGLPDSAVREAMERVRAAIKNSGYRFPMERITINLAPADLRKEGAAFDVAIAAGILLTSGQWQWPVAKDDERAINVEHCLWLGELALDGTVRAVNGLLAMLEMAKSCGIRHIFLPAANELEASMIRDLYFYPLRHLRDAERYLRDGSDPQSSVHLHNQMERTKVTHQINLDDALVDADLCDVVGQTQAKRALLIAAAGMHNLVMLGPPGSGKTMLARRLISILPELDEQEAFEVTKVYSVANKINERGAIIKQRPFRAPHHSITTSSLIGGERRTRPGEISLAHHGVLFLDELPEFPRHALEMLRQPLEDRYVVIGRAQGACRLPANFMLVGALNPCPCGYFGFDYDGARECRCTLHRIKQYKAKLSGPLLDRIDIQVEMTPPELRSFHSHKQPSNDRTLSSAEARNIVTEVHRIQKNRRQHLEKRYNSYWNREHLQKFCALDREGKQCLEHAFRTLGLSARAHERIIKIARTIADLAGSEVIKLPHLSEALQLRALDRFHALYEKALR